MLVPLQRYMSGRKPKALPKLILWKSETRIKKEWEANIFFSTDHIHTKLERHSWNPKYSTAKGNHDLSPSDPDWKQTRRFCPSDTPLLYFQLLFDSTGLLILIPFFSLSLKHMSLKLSFLKTLKGKKKNKFSQINSCLQECCNYLYLLSELTNIVGSQRQCCALHLLQYYTDIVTASYNTVFHHQVGYLSGNSAAVLLSVIMLESWQRHILFFPIFRVFFSFPLVKYTQMGFQLQVSHLTWNQPRQHAAAAAAASLFL
jgi:hypothetical protein